MEPEMHYAPLYVSPLFSTNHPTPPTATTALYTLSAQPRFVLEIGTCVHLHFLYAPTSIIDDSLASVPDPMSIPLAIKGRIAGERARTGVEVEYVIKNEERNSPIRRAFVRLRLRPEDPMLPDFGELLARRFPDAPTGKLVSAEKKRPRRARSGPLPRHGSFAAPDALALAALPPPPEPRTEPDEQQAMTVSLYPTNNSARTRGPIGGPGVASRPYNIWETYGGNTASFSTQAEADAIRNYGCPILVGPLSSRGELPHPNAAERQTPESTREM